MTNPANAPETTLVEEGRIPMSLPVQRLATPEIPGYHLHWFYGAPDRLARARAAGYRFVEQDEIQPTEKGVANSATSNGSTDMGSRVTVIAGGDLDHGGQPVRMVLMKLPQHLWLEDQKRLEAENEKTAEALRGTPANQPGGDNSHRYTPKNAPQRNMFMKRT